MKKDITRLFCLVDDFLKVLEEEKHKKQDRVYKFDVFERLFWQKIQPPIKTAVIKIVEILCSIYPEKWQSVIFSDFQEFFSCHYFDLSDFWEFFA